MHFSASVWGSDDQQTLPGKPLEPRFWWRTGRRSSLYCISLKGKCNHFNVERSFSLLFLCRLSRHN
ncbi:unnamed protein product [Ixodes pacificus]